ncbi:hypothetical protein L9F63_026706, partial [Diploptera punctata]
MKYLERVIKEMLRLCPSVPLFGRILKKDVQIDGHTLPAGLLVGFLVILIHRNPEYFPDPEEFNPDNFLPERVAARHPYAYIPFSAGPRNCIGQKFAILEEKTILSNIIRNYKINATGTEPIINPDLILRSENVVNFLRFRRVVIVHKRLEKKTPPTTTADWPLLLGSSGSKKQELTKR